jgi:hypothetical protein
MCLLCQGMFEEVGVGQYVGQSVHKLPRALCRACCRDLLRLKSGYWEN